MNVPAVVIDLEKTPVRVANWRHGTESSRPGWHQFTVHGGNGMTIVFFISGLKFGLQLAIFAIPVDNILYRRNIQCRGFLINPGQCPVTGKVALPPSALSSPLSNASRVDLPHPFLPTSPTLARLIVAVALSSKTRVPRRI